MKLLWHSVAPWVGTGYGSQTGLFTPRIRDLGHDVAISAYYGLYGMETVWQGMCCLPAYAAHYGNDVIVPHAVHHFGGGEGDSFREVANRGLIITLTDVWVLNAPLLPDMNVASWTPVDHETVPGITLSWFAHTGAIPIAMSKFGERSLREVGLDPLYVPHGYDPEVFFPADKAQARERVGVPQDAFAVAMVAANVGKDASRKAFAEQITAFGDLRRRHSDAVLLLHTDIDTSTGVNIQDLIRDFPEGSVVYTDQYLYRKGVPASTVADIYRAADVLTNTSWGEGFGIPIVESQAVGTPVIVTDTTAMPELCGSGWKVPGEIWWHDSQKAWARRPYIAAIAEAYEEAYDKARGDDMRAQAWEFAQGYTVDAVMEQHWRPVLAKLEAALERRRDDAAKPRRSAPKVREADGLLWLDRPGTDDWVSYTDHEAYLRPIFDDLLPDGGVLLDVGAHVGRWALRLAARASQVIAVEANPDTAATLRRHLAMNDVNNVTVVRVAAWDETTRLRLADPNGRTDGGGTRTLPSDGDDGTVAAMPLDDNDDVGFVLASTGRLDLVKLDLEGADIHALNGMAGLLAKYRPTLLIECHDIYGYYERADLEDCLTRLGYTFEVAASNPSTWHPDGPVESRPADYLVAEPKDT